MRTAIIALTLMAAVTVALARPPQQAPQDSGERKTPCKTAENASMCYWTRGRLSVYNGWPPWRMWKVGTNRILAIYSGPSTWNIPDARMKDAADPEFATDLVDAYPEPAETAIPPSVFAAFEICPLDEDLSGVMQHACIESAKNIRVEQSH